MRIASSASPSANLSSDSSRPFSISWAAFSEILPSATPSAHDVLEGDDRGLEWVIGRRARGRGG